MQLTCADTLISREITILYAIVVFLTDTVNSCDLLKISYYVLVSVHPGSETLFFSFGCCSVDLSLRV